jgi:hypothetical protein
MEQYTGTMINYATNRPMYFKFISSPAAITCRTEFLRTKCQDMNKGLAQREIIHCTKIKEVRKIGKGKGKGTQ